MCASVCLSVCFDFFSYSFFLTDVPTYHRMLYDVITHIKNSVCLSLQSCHTFFLKQSYDEETGTETDTLRLARKLLNRAMAARVISQQEVMVELGCLPLVICSETIQPISISLNKKATGNADRTTRTFVEQYGTRNRIHHHLSLKDYFDLQWNKTKTKKGTTIPHFIGGSTYSTYPITEAYARSMLYIYKPWSKMNPIPDKNYKKQFETFLEQDDCPVELKIINQREKERQQHRQPTSRDGEGDYQNAPDTEDTPINDILHLAGLFNRSMDEQGELHGTKVNKGLHYKWDRRVSLSEDITLNADTWLLDQILNERDTKDSLENNTKLKLKKGIDGKPLTFKTANEDQKNIILKIFAKVKEWIEWNKDTDSNNRSFRPLRLTGEFTDVYIQDPIQSLHI